MYQQYQQKFNSLDEFEILQRLGEGSFGSVYKIRRKSNNKFYALKKVQFKNLSHKEREGALNEVRILASLNSPYIIKYKDSFYDESSGFLCIIMEYASNGDLQGLIEKNKKANKSIPEDTIWEYTAQILMGIKCLHSMNILHRDLKGANIFLSEDGKIVKLGDLNVSKVAKSNFVYTQTGTPYYLSPEVWQGQAYNNKCDVWSLGCVIYEICTFQPPFNGTSLDNLRKNVIRGQYQKIPQNKYSAELSRFISLCLILNPNNRPNVQALLDFPQIKSRVHFDPAEEKAQILKTIKLPYGNLNALKNILPKPKYEENAQQQGQEEQKASQPQTSQQQNQQKPLQQQPPANQANRPNSAYPNSVQEPQQQPQFKPAPGQQQQQQQQQYNQKPAAGMQNAQNQQNYQQRQQRSQSQEKLMQNYQNNNYYNKNYGQQKSNENEQKNSNSNKPISGGNKPPLAGQKPPAGLPNQQQKAQQYGNQGNQNQGQRQIKQYIQDDSQLVHKPSFSQQNSPSNKNAQANYNKKKMFY